MPVDISPAYLYSHMRRRGGYNGPLERQIESVSKAYGAIFRRSAKGVPHLVFLGEIQAYSIGYFKKGNFWRVFYPYGIGSKQKRRDFNTAREAFEFIEDTERGLHEVT